jgi:excisionase family DNA binding protein
MLLLNSVEPEKWYTVSETARILGWSEDTIYRRIEDGVLQAQVKEGDSRRRKRKYVSVRVQGCEIIRYAKEHMTTLKPERVRFQAA